MHCMYYRVGAEGYSYMPVVGFAHTAGQAEAAQMAGTATAPVAALSVRVRLPYITYASQTVW